MKITNAIETTNGQTYVRLSRPSDGEYDKHLTQRQISEIISARAPLNRTTDLCDELDSAFRAGDADAVAKLYYGLFR